jgi:hypothetical protein
VRDERAVYGLVPVPDPAEDSDVNALDVLRRVREERREDELGVVPYEATSGWISKASEAELKGVEDGD